MPNGQQPEQRAMDPQIEERVRQLFQESYQVIYKDGKFDTMADQAEADGSIVNAVTQLIAAIVNSTIKDAGVDDINTLFAFAVILMSDLVESLDQIGIKAQEGDLETIISNTMQQVLAANPTFAQKVMQSPELQEAMQMAGPEGQATMQQTAQQTAQQQQGQGVLTQAEGE